MKAGSKIILTENTIVVDAFGTDYLLKGSTGVVKTNSGEMLTVKMAKGTYEIPAVSTKAVAEDQAA